MTALRPYTLLSFLFLYHTHTHHIFLSLILFVLCLSLDYLFLYHTHTDNGILYIVSLTQRHLHERLGEHRHGIQSYQCDDNYYTIHTQGTHIFPFALSVFLSDSLFSHTYTHTNAALLSVLEFYILMKEEARRPIRAAGRGRDHVSVDSRVAQIYLDGALPGLCLPALPHDIPSSVSVAWYNPLGSIRTPPLCLPLFCQC